MLSKAQMKVVVDQIVRSGNELKRYMDAEDDSAQPGPPASAQVLSAFKQKYGTRVPPSYLQLLSIHDGIKNFEWMDVSLLSAQYLLEHEHLDRPWIDVGAYGRDEIFVFAESNSDAHAVAFLLKTVDDRGEMRVAHFDASGPLTEHTDLEGYLRDRLKWFEDSVASEKADRAGLAGDD
jgi:hypothetical protein